MSRSASSSLRDTQEGLHIPLINLTDPAPRLLEDHPSIICGEIAQGFLIQRWQNR